MNQTSALTCAACGARVTLPPDSDQTTCAHCGTALIIERGAEYAITRRLDTVTQTVVQLRQQEAVLAARAEIARLDTELRTLQRSRATRAARAQHDLVTVQWNRAVKRLQAAEQAAGLPLSYQSVDPRPQGISPWLLIIMLIGVLALLGGHLPLALAVVTLLAVLGFAVLIWARRRARKRS